MDFLKTNLINTSTQIAVNSNTTTASNLFNRDKLYQYSSDQLNNDLTSAAITITFDTTMSVSRIALIDMNFKDFSIFYNGSTASTFTLSSGDTIASSYTNNLDEHKYFQFATVQCSSITINAKKTVVADQEKRLGLFVISDLDLSLTLIPSAKKYKPTKVPKQIVHKLSDGGSRLHNISSKWSLDFSLDYVSAAQRDSLFDIYDSGLPFNFCPFGTTTAWDGTIFESVWDGPFEFYQFSDDAATSGFSGKVSLLETPI